MSKLEIIGFDLDGTLLDSIPQMELSWLAATYSAGVSCPFSRYVKYLGLEFDEILKKINLYEYSPIIKKKYFEYSSANMSNSSLFPEAKNVLSQLKSHYRLILITSKPRLTCEKILSQEGLDFFDMVHCGGDLQNRGKPDPKIIFDILDHYGKHSDSFLYVGDSPIDLLFSLNASVRFALKTSSYYDFSRLSNNILRFSRWQDFPGLIGVVNEGVRP